MKIDNINNKDINFFRSNITTFCCEQSDITLTNDHQYIVETKPPYCDKGFLVKCDSSVTKILNPREIPDYPHIRAAAAHGTAVHEALDKLIEYNRSHSSGGAIDCRNFFNDLGDAVQMSFTSLLKQVIGIVGCNMSKLANMRVRHRLIGVAYFEKDNGDDYVLSFGATPDVLVTSRDIANRNELATLPVGVYEKEIVDAVIEFKTTTTRSRDHLRQLAIYMHLSKAPIGVLLYDRHEMKVLRSTDTDYLTLVREFYIKAHTFYQMKHGPRIQYDPANAILREIAELSNEIKELDRQRGRCEDTRKALLEDYLEACQQARQQLESIGKVEIDTEDYKISYRRQVRLNTTLTNVEALKSLIPDRYQQFIKEKQIISYVLNYQDKHASKVLQ